MRRTYTQTQVEEIFERAVAAADESGMVAGDRYAYILGHVVSALNVQTSVYPASAVTQ